jgi:hypothetical protein
MDRKALMLFVEGEGDEHAVPVLVKKLLSERDAWEHVSLDEHVFRVHGVENLTGRKAANWVRFLQAAVKRRRVGGILLVLDGDRAKVVNATTGDQEPFCAADVARRLATEARSAGGGSVFSVACVFARQEYESWLLAGIDSLRGKPLSDGRPGVRADVVFAAENADEVPRGAKGALSRLMINGYKPTTDQAELTRLVSLESIRQANSRSFKRLEHAVVELCEAMRSGKQIVSPAPSPEPA